MKPDASITQTATAGTDNDDEPDEWDKRILKTGCYQENLNLQLCHADKGDWRQCLKEMQLFRECWEKNKNNERTSTVDNDEASK
ncbi:Cytochrome oxidase assembly factor 4 [Candida viswanathii]|uniref:Cytochrome oxidase assembly factor 4 n=1 Tax=Candida viswanathii TaxID=5486 RepID=A0A367YME6_9ASCO|nr:Cytochrome oxidase assembly factor 4 [Candida viswanathii]